MNRISMGFIALLLVTSTPVFAGRWEASHQAQGSFVNYRRNGPNNLSLAGIISA